MQVCNHSKLVPISVYNFFLKIDIIRTAHSIIPATHLRKTGISVPPYVLILKAINTPSVVTLDHLTCIIFW